MPKKPEHPAMREAKRIQKLHKDLPLAVGVITKDGFAAVPYFGPELPIFVTKDSR